MDRWMMLGGLVLFGMVVFNILRKRIWIPGLSTLFSLLRYVLLGGSSKTAVAVTSPMVMATTSSADVVSTTSGCTYRSIVAKETLVVTTTVPVAASHKEEQGPLEEDTASVEYALSTEGITASSHGLPLEDEAVATGGLNDEPEQTDEPVTTTSQHQQQHQHQQQPVENFRRKNIYTMPVERPVHEEL
ncbi:hypothetical protein DL89DRAFT_257134 [Linderina pennispora]|uniref:Uncharacterized protein n=1 Tax=Linderina pennispora TaxID=61395 RepID=A0A1Y1WC15_9FUNG|nr:uncharacterized protein DL89DRAFT_257134 [Linderina pennispora]ORX70972.1 hypothetical protein DL89DRAFT_257134 [Linderina pennispora]